jgi:hypothetical protein
MHDSSTRESHDQARGTTQWENGCKESSGCRLFADGDAAKGSQGK